MFRRFVFALTLSLPALAQDPIAPHSASEPPAAKAAASLAASTKASPPELLTTGEKSDWNETAPYAEAVEISRRLERTSRFVKVLDIGTTPEGRTMIALVVSKDRAFTPEAAAAGVRDRFIPGLAKRMAADGHLVAPYGALRNVGGKREFFMEVFSPRYSHLYSAVQNRPSLLVETHSLKAAKTRAWAHYDIMRHTVETILLDPEGLRKAVREADRQLMARAGDRNAAPVYLAGKVSDK